jgi:GT2 family glycosyltransferase
MVKEKEECSQPLFVGPSELVHAQRKGQPPAQADASGLVSIVIPCCGQLEYTRLSVPRVLRYSRRPFELIFVDAGSLDGTPEFLAGVAAAASVPVEVVGTPAESGFGAACAEGLARARGEFLVWLNNDVLVTEGWLEQLVALATSNPVIGMVGPMSNYAPGQQWVTEVPYRLRLNRSERASAAGGNQHREDTEALDRFAREWRERHKGGWFEAERLGGFCLLLKREVANKVGFLSEEWEEGIFDADRLSREVRQAGYRVPVSVLSRPVHPPLRKPSSRSVAEEIYSHGETRSSWRGEAGAQLSQVHASDDNRTALGTPTSALDKPQSA